MIGAKEKMIQNTNKRCASTPENASSFYKRLGLDLIAPFPATSGLPQETVQISSTPQSTPLQRQDKGVQQWLQSQQRDRQTHSVISTQPNPNTRAESVITATSNLSQYAQCSRPHGYQSSRPHGYRPTSPHVNQPGQFEGYQSTHPHEYQPNYSNGYHKTQHDGYQSTQTLSQGFRETVFANKDDIYRPQQPQNEHQSHPTADMMRTYGGFHPHQNHQQSGYHPQPLQLQQTQSESRPRPRPARKEPQVKPIDKYSAPDYVKIMYHPTPTLEDLGLTSYLDSPPSSPRAVSTSREGAKHNAASATSGSRQPMTTWAVQSKQPNLTETVKSKKTTTLAPWKLIKITLPPVSRVTLEERLAVASKRAEAFGQSKTDQTVFKPVLDGKPTALSKTAGSDHGVDQSNNEKSRDFVQQQVITPKNGSALCATSSAALTPATKRKVLESNRDETETPRKKKCVWATVAEQYATDSHKSQNQEAKRDAAYKRYNSDGRPQMRQFMNDAVRHQTLGSAYQTYNKTQHQPYLTESFDQILAHEKARQNVSQSQDKSVAHAVRHVQINHDNGVASIMDADSRSKGPQTPDSSISLDNFGGMSPFSCWTQTTPGDPRFS